MKTPLIIVTLVASIKANVGCYEYNPWNPVESSIAAAMIGAYMAQYPQVPEPEPYCVESVMGACIRERLCL
jgi:hypothetical protein